MANNKKVLELDARMQKVIDEEFADYEKYLGTPQDVAMYRRKRKEYWTKITARLKEGTTDGRTDDSGND